MKRLTDRQTGAIKRLLPSADFQTFLGWFEESLKEADEHNRTGVGAELHQCQGRAQVLAEVLRRVGETRAR